jgi:hypothetical protein
MLIHVTASYYELLVGRQAKIKQATGREQAGMARRLEVEEGALGGHPPDGLHEAGELQHLGQLQAPLRLRRRPLLLRLATRLGDVVLRLLQCLGALLVKLPLRTQPPIEAAAVEIHRHA